MDLLYNDLVFYFLLSFVRVVEKFVVFQNEDRYECACSDSLR